MTLQNCPGLGMFRTRKMKIDIETEKGHFHSGRSTRPSGCMTLQIGWLHGGANWHSGEAWSPKTALESTEQHWASGVKVV
jgi:hypothetical protein